MACFLYHREGPRNPGINGQQRRHSQQDFQTKQMQKLETPTSTKLTAPPWRHLFMHRSALLFLTFLCIQSSDIKDSTICCPGIHIPWMTSHADLQHKTASRSEKKNHQNGRQEASYKDEKRRNKIKGEEKISWGESWKVGKTQHQKPKSSSR